MSFIVCDDLPISRGGVVAAVIETDRVVVAAEAAVGKSWGAKLEIYQPDVLITDQSMHLFNGF